MEHFRNINQINEEKLRLQRECESLEKKITNDWKDFKLSLRPSNIAGQIVDGLLEHKSKNSAFGKILKQGLLDIAGKFIVTAGNKMEKWLRV